ncbi:Hypothetical predicted protein [Marmota monax]|uniref:Uncharacterized protein n=1 Tax=Marmota monax TaxID=9995 RepID=A0A5E4BVC8_MARMO|nr:hypothetical protein GHT09_007038 [Marmota monax]VTJ72889.1 Hypothetical predicted protein [Marmota monax]
MFTRATSSQHPSLGTSECQHQPASPNTALFPRERPSGGAARARPRSTPPPRCPRALGSERRRSGIRALLGRWLGGRAAGRGPARGRPASR